jgi:hypothetical protein
MRMRQIKVATAALLAAGLVLTAPAPAQETAAAKNEKANEKKIAAMSLPAAVKKTVREQSDGAVIVTIAREIRDWKTVYEVAMTVEGKTKDIIVGTDGKVLVSEVAIEMAKVPEAVRETVEKNLGKAKLLEVLSVTEGDKITHYEARLKEGKKLSELKVSPAGELLPPDPAEDEE